MDKQEINETVAKFEKEISDIRIRQRAIADRLQTAYQYKDRMTIVLIKNEEDIKSLQIQVFSVSNEIQPKIDEMKKAFQLYTNSLIMK